MTQFERQLIQKHTQVCLAPAWAPGRKDGRYPVSRDDPRVVTAKRLHQDRGLSIDQICTGRIFSTAFNEVIAELLRESARPRGEKLAELAEESVAQAFAGNRNRR